MIEITKECEYVTISNKKKHGYFNSIFQKYDDFM